MHVCMDSLWNEKRTTILKEKEDIMGNNSYSGNSSDGYDSPPYINLDFSFVQHNLKQSRNLHYSDLPKNKCPEKCLVCGDPATGYHYEVGSCNGCKTFFRRTVIGQKKYTCRRGKECFKFTDKKETVKCRACRFESCVVAGMNPLAIVSEPNPDENVIIKEIVAKRMRDRESEIESIEPSTSSTTTNTCTNLSVAKVFVAPTLIENTMERLIEGLLHLEFAFDRLRRSKHTGFHDSGLTLDSAISGHSLLGMDFGEMDQDKFFHRPPRPPGHGPPQSPEDHAKLRIPFPKRPSLTAERREKFKDWQVLDALYAIEYLKTFEFFHRLTTKDKKLLARHTALLSANISNAFFSYTNKSDITLHPNGMRPFGGNLLNSEHLSIVHKKMISVMIELRPDKKEYVLMKAILVCNPAIDDLSDDGKVILSEYRERYAKSLLSYVIAYKGVLEGPSAYASRLAAFDTLIHVTKKQKDMYVLLSILGLFNDDVQSQLVEEVHNC